MKFNLNKIVSLLIMLSFLTPVIAGAQVNGKMGKDNNKPENKPAENFCLRLDNINTKLAEQIKKAEEKQSLYQTNRTEILNKKESEVDAKKAQNRTTIDEKRVKNWDKMISKAKTDEQKAAILKYKTTIENAIKTRRVLVDSAISNYRNGLSGTVSSHTTTTDVAIKTFEKSVNDALSQAKNDCANKIDSKNVNATFVQKINEARKTLQQSKQEVETNTAIKELKKTRDEIITNAEKDFKATIEKAKEELFIILKK